MGGRGSSYTGYGNGNELNILLRNEFKGPKIRDIKDPNDDVTKKETQIIEKLKRKRNIVVYKSTDKIDEVLLNKNLTAVDNVLDVMKNDYGISYKHLIGDGSSKRSSIRASKGDNSYYAYATRDSKGNFKMYLNKRVYEVDNAEEKLINSTKKQILSGDSPKVPDDKLSDYVIVHELGHLVQYALYRKDSQKKVYDNNEFIRYATKMRDDVLIIAKGKYKEKNNAVCKYAAKNSVEWFAETFASMHLNGIESSGLTKALNDYLKGERK